MPDRVAGLAYFSGENLVSNRIAQRSLWRGLGSGLALLLVLCVSLPAFAQLAPVMGAHYAARPSDTGFTGGANSGGAYGASVPLDLPAARGGLPIPVSVAYGGNQVGAAGLGWDVPISSIFRSKSLARHRPKPGTFSGAASDPLPLPEMLTVSLGGEAIDLVRSPDGAAWVARHGDAQLEVRDLGNGSMALYDGNGLTYSFDASGGTSGGQLDNGNLYLLRDITGTAG